MAVIGRIRKRVGLLIAFVGVSMLLFILGDLVTSNKGVMSRNSDVLGIIGGEKVRYPEFEKKVEQMIENYKESQKKENVDQNTTDMIREQTWNQTLNELTIGKEEKTLGIACGAEELYDMCTGHNVHQQIRQAFADRKTGMFNPQDVVRFLKDLPNRDEATQKQWKNFEEALHDERIADKYKELIKGGIYVTTAEAKQSHLESNRMASIKYIRFDYASIADADVKLEDSDLKKYYNEHQSDYKQAETVRKAEYVAFDIQPSAEDKGIATEWINKKKEEFVASKNDTVFVAENSDVPFDSIFKAKGALPPALDTTLFTASIGTIVGPYTEGNTLKMAKLLSIRMMSDSVRARHILIKFVNNDTLGAKRKADSLKTLIKKGQKFEDLAKKFSEDGSAMKGGDLGWFQQHRMVGPFNDACFNGKKGDMPIVQTEFGIHLIEITDKGPASKQVQVAVVERKVEPSQKTYDAIYNKASEFAAAASTGEQFDAVVKKQGLMMRIADNMKESDKTIGGLEQPREMIRWAYKANKGEVSKVFTFGDKYVVAHLLDIKEKGILPLESVKDQVTAGARKAKKGDMLIEKFKTKAEGATTIDAVGQKVGVTPLTADNLNFGNPFIAGLGNEPHVLGTVFAMKAGAVSQPIRGEAGVYVVSVSQFTEPAPTTNYNANQKQLMDSRKQRSDFEVFNALKEKMGVEDLRGKFY